MRRVSALLAALSVTATGCSFSSVDPHAEVTISGRALDAAGGPLSGAKVLLFKQADLGEVVFGSILTIGTLGAACLLPAAPTICRKAVTATADDDGRYKFKVEGADTQGTLGTESTLNVVFSGPAGQGSTAVSFHAKESTVRLPDARLWNARPRVAGNARSIRLSWAGLPAAAGSDRSYSAEVFEKNGQAALWSQPARGTETSIDPRILEDRAGSVAVNASGTLAGADGAGDVTASYLSSHVAVRSSSGRPPSRGRRCAPVTGTAPALDGRFAGCAATDGDLDSPAHLSGDGVVTGVAVDLGSRGPIRLVVGRGLSGQVLLEVSDDGKNFRVVATGSGTAVGLTPNGSTSARYIRLRSPSGVDQSLVSEISVWS